MSDLAGKADITLGMHIYFQAKDCMIKTKKWEQIIIKIISMYVYLDLDLTRQLVEVHHNFELSVTNWLSVKDYL